MGLDFTNYQLFCGNARSKSLHIELIEKLPGLMSQIGFHSSNNLGECDRFIVIGPPDRWISIYDSLAIGFRLEDNFPIFLSMLSPIILVHMYDSSILHFSLFQNGEKTDDFNSAPDFHKWYMDRWYPNESHKESDYYGNLDLWKKFLLAPNKVTTLSKAWKQEHAKDILQKTAQVLGWNQNLCRYGYSVNDDGFTTHYYDYLDESDFSQTQCFTFSSIPG